jgi:hypothetical protein
MGQEWIVPDAEPDELVDAGGEPPVDEPEANDQVRPIERFRRGAVGGVLAAGLTGLADALEPREKDTVAIVETVDGDPGRQERIVLRLDPDDPGDSIVMIRR